MQSHAFHNYPYHHLQKSRHFDISKYSMPCDVASQLMKNYFLVYLFTDTTFNDI